jgi:sugar lactone lactonase YvrE
MTTGSWHAARGGAAALAFAALLAGCGGGDGGGRSDDSATRQPASSSQTADAGPSTTAAAPQPGVLRTLAAWAGAPDPGGAGHHDGKGSAARFTQPRAVAAASDGSYWIVEASGRRVRRVDAEGSVTTLFDAATERLSFDVDGRRVLLTRPHALAAAPSGAIFGAMQELRLNPDGSAAEGGPLAVVRVVPGAPLQLVVPPEPAQGLSGAIAMALDKQGRLYVAAGCGIWRTDEEVIATTGPRTLQRVYPAPGSTCGGNSFTSWVDRLAVDADGRAVFTLTGGDVMRLEPDLRVTALGRTSAGPGFVCGGMVADRHGGLLINGETAVLRLDAATGREQVVAGHPHHAGWLDGSTETARFGSICGLAIDGQGRVVLVDHDNHNLRRGEPDGRVTTVAGLAQQEGHRDGTGQDALFGRYFRIKAGTGDEVLVGDWWNGTLRSVDARQRVSTLVGAPPAEGDFSHVATDGPVATARLSFGSAAARTPDGSLWIADDSKLRRLGPDGIVRTVAMSYVDDVWDLGLDPDGNLVVAWGYTAVGFSGPGISAVRFERYSGRTPDAAPEILELRLPDDLSDRVAGERLYGLCVLPDRSIAYTQGHAVLRRAADGTVALLAGSPGEPGHADGPALSARFGRAQGLACDSSGGIYVADTDNHTVRYIDAQRRVRTVLGTPGRRGHRFDSLPGELSLPSSLALVPGGLVVATGQGLVRAGF